MFDTFTLLEFDGQLPDALYLEAAHDDYKIIAENDPRAARYSEDFEQLLIDSLSPERSIEFIRNVAEEMS
jgi:hypothetical protein